MHVVIQRDGRILIQENGEEDRFADPNDPISIVACFRATVELEDGLTSAQLMRALRPWSAVLSRAAWMDFDAWIGALDRPLVKLVDGEEDGGRLVSIELVPTFDVYRGERPDGIELSVHPAWRPLGNRVDANGAEMEPCSLSFMDPKEYAHLPLLICEKVSVKDVQSLPPFGQEAIIPDTLPGTYDRITETPTFFDTIVLGFLDDISFHGSPADTAEEGQSLAEMVKAISRGEVETIPIKVTESDDEGDGGNGYTVSFDEFLTTLDIKLPKGDRERVDLADGIAKAFAAADFPHETAARVLGLTEAGLMKLLAGQTSSFSIPTLKVFVGRLRVLKAVREFVAGASKLYGDRFEMASLVGLHAQGIGNDGHIVDVGIVLKGEVDYDAEVEVMSGLTHGVVTESAVSVSPWPVSRSEFPFGGNLVRDIVKEGISLGADGKPLAGGPVGPGGSGSARMAGSSQGDR